MTVSGPAKRRIIPGSPFNVPPAHTEQPEHYAISDRVTHDKHGLGTVIGIKGDTEVTVDFGSNVARHFTLPNAKLTKL
jgi:hypothetical protein